RITRGVLAAPDGREYLPLAAGTMQPVTVLAIGSVQMPVLIDSGSSSGLSVTPDVARGLAFSHGPVDWFLARSAGADYRPRVGRLALDALVGHQVFERPVIRIVPAPREARMGAEALALFTVTFDRRQNVVRFVRDTRDPIRSPPVRTTGIAF